MPALHCIQGIAEDVDWEDSEVHIAGNGEGGVSFSPRSPRKHLDACDALTSVFTAPMDAFHAYHTHHRRRPGGPLEATRAGTRGAVQGCGRADSPCWSR